MAKWPSEHVLPFKLDNEIIKAASSDDDDELDDEDDDDDEAEDSDSYSEEEDELRVPSEDEAELEKFRITREEWIKIQFRNGNRTLADSNGGASVKRPLADNTAHEYNAWGNIFFSHVHGDNEVQYGCSTCQLRYDTLDKFVQHIKHGHRSQHQQAKRTRYDAEDKPRPAATLAQLGLAKGKVRVMSNQAPQFVCSVCDFKNTNLDALLRHVRHTHGVTLVPLPTTGSQRLIKDKPSKGKHRPHNFVTPVSPPATIAGARPPAAGRPKSAKPPTFSHPLLGPLVHLKTNNDVAPRPHPKDGEKRTPAAESNLNKDNISVIPKSQSAPEDDAVVLHIQRLLSEPIWTSPPKKDRPSSGPPQSKDSKTDICTIPKPGPLINDKASRTHPAKQVLDPPISKKAHTSSVPGPNIKETGRCSDPSGIFISTIDENISETPSGKTSPGIFQSLLSDPTGIFASTTNDTSPGVFQSVPSAVLSVGPKSTPYHFNSNDSISILPVSTNTNDRAKHTPSIEPSFSLTPLSASAGSANHSKDNISLAAAGKPAPAKVLAVAPMPRPPPNNDRAKSTPPTAPGFSHAIAPLRLRSLCNYKESTCSIRPVGIRKPSPWPSSNDRAKSTPPATRRLSDVTPPPIGPPMNNNKDNTYINPTPGQLAVSFDEPLYAPLYGPHISNKPPGGHINHSTAARRLSDTLNRNPLFEPFGPPINNHNPCLVAPIWGPVKRNPAYGVHGRKPNSCPCTPKRSESLDKWPPQINLPTRNSPNDALPRAPEQIMLQASQMPVEAEKPQIYKENGKPSKKKVCAPQLPQLTRYEDPRSNCMAGTSSRAQPPQTAVQAKENQHQRQNLSTSASLKDQIYRTEQCAFPSFSNAHFSTPSYAGMPVLPPKTYAIEGAIRAMEEKFGFASSSNFVANTTRQVSTAANPVEAWRLESVNRPNLPAVAAQSQIPTSPFNTPSRLGEPPKLTRQKQSSPGFLMNQPPQLFPGPKGNYHHQNFNPNFYLQHRMYLAEQFASTPFNNAHFDMHNRYPLLPVMKPAPVLEEHARHQGPIRAMEQELVGCYGLNLPTKEINGPAADASANLVNEVVNVSNEKPEEPATVKPIISTHPIDTINPLDLTTVPEDIQNSQNSNPSPAEQASTAKEDPKTLEVEVSVLPETLTFTTSSTAEVSKLIPDNLKTQPEVNGELTKVSTCAPSMKAAEPEADNYLETIESDSGEPEKLQGNDAVNAEPKADHYLEPIESSLGEDENLQGNDAVNAEPKADHYLEPIETSSREAEKPQVIDAVNVEPKADTYLELTENTSEKAENLQANDAVNAQPKADTYLEPTESTSEKAEKPQANDAVDAQPKADHYLEPMESSSEETEKLQVNDAVSTPPKDNHWEPMESSEEENLQKNDAVNAPPKADNHLEPTESTSGEAEKLQVNDAVNDEPKADNHLEPNESTSEEGENLQGNDAVNDQPKADNHLEPNESTSEETEKLKIHDAAVDQLDEAIIQVAIPTATADTDNCSLLVTNDSNKTLSQVPNVASNALTSAADLIAIKLEEEFISCCPSSQVTIYQIDILPTRDTDIGTPSNAPIPQQRKAEEEAPIPQIDTAPPAASNTDSALDTPREAEATSYAAGAASDQWTIITINSAETAAVPDYSTFEGAVPLEQPKEKTETSPPTNMQPPNILEKSTKSKRKSSVETIKDTKNRRGRKRKATLPTEEENIPEIKIEPNATTSESSASGRRLRHRNKPTCYTENLNEEDDRRQLQPPAKRPRVRKSTKKDEETKSKSPATGSSSPANVSISLETASNSPAPGSMSSATVSISAASVSISAATGSLSPATVSISPVTVSTSPATVSEASVSTRKSSSRANTRPVKYDCDECNRSFRKASRLLEHKRLHTGEKPFKCEECNREFRIKTRLSEHMMRHRKEKAFKCELCGMGVATKQDLVLHNRHHIKDRRFKCEQCPKAFVRNSDLKVHLRIHTGEKPYVCEVCCRAFTANQNLTIHRRAHFGEKNFKCDYCDKRFIRNIDRKVHHRTHTGEKPYTCEICGKGYSLRLHVTAHMEREHNPDKSARPRTKPGPKPGQPRKPKEQKEPKERKQLKQVVTKEKRDTESVSSYENTSTTQATETTQTTQRAPSDLDQQENQAEFMESLQALLSDNEEEEMTAFKNKKARPTSTATSVSSPLLSPATPKTPPPQAATVQQVSVTLSMQVADADEPTMREKENVHEAPLEKQRQQCQQRLPAVAAAVKKERNKTSYFSILDGRN